MMSHKHGSLTVLAALPAALLLLAACLPRSEAGVVTGDLLLFNNGSKVLEVSRAEIPNKV